MDLPNLVTQGERNTGLLVLLVQEIEQCHDSEPISGDTMDNLVMKLCCSHRDEKNDLNASELTHQIAHLQDDFRH